MFERYAISGIGLSRYLRIRRWRMPFSLKHSAIGIRGALSRRRARSASCGVRRDIEVESSDWGVKSRANVEGACNLGQGHDVGFVEKLAIIRRATTAQLPRLGTMRERKRGARMSESAQVIAPTKALLLFESRALL
jgi:hypothetical protein